MRITSHCYMMTVKIAAFAGLAYSWAVSPAGAVPVDGGSNLVAHYDASVLASSGGSVTSWTNQGTGGSVLDATPVVNSPALVNGAVNGLPVVSFAGGSSDEHLRTGVLGSALPQPLTVYHVGLANTVSNNPYWYDAATGTSRIAYLHRDNPGVNNPDQFAGVEVSGGTAPVGSFNIWALEFNSPNSEIRLNGSTFLSTGNVGSSGFQSLTLGARFTDAQQINGDIAELAVVAGSINTAEQRVIENHLSSKYDVTLAAGDLYIGDSALNGDNDFDVFGIGSDGTDTLNTSARGGLVLDGGGNLSAGEWALAGHDGTPNGLVAVDPLNDRWTRNWFVDFTNLDSDDLTLSFDWQAAGLGPIDPGLNKLFFSSDGTTFSTVDIAQTSVVGDTIQFTISGAALSDGFFTLGQAVPEPSTGLLLCGGLAVLLRRRRRKR